MNAKQVPPLGYKRCIWEVEVLVTHPNQQPCWLPTRVGDEREFMTLAGAQKKAVRDWGAPSRVVATGRDGSKWVLP